MRANAFSVWVMKATCIAAGLFGLISAAASHPSLDAPWALLFDVLRWPVDGQQGQFSAEARVLNAVLGGILVSWSVLLYWMIQGPIRTNVPGAKRVYVLSVLAWFVIDTSGSFAADWVGNALFNVFFLGGALLPLAFLSQPTTVSPD
jgi:hypothetical protein